MRQARALFTAGLVAAALARPATAGADAPAADVEERLGAALPYGIPLRDGAGRTVLLGEAVRGERPTVLVLSSYECPMLCGLVLAGLTRALGEAGLVPGDDVRLLTVSFDPRDGPEAAARKQATALEALPAATPGAWPFLVGEARRTRALTDAIGFRTSFDGEAGQWVHPAALVVLTPDGRVSRYLYGIDYRPRDLRLAVAEAGLGRSGPSFERLLLSCFAYDPTTRRYELGGAEVVRLATALLALVATSAAAVTCVRELRAEARSSGKA